MIFPRAVAIAAALAIQSCSSIEVEQGCGEPAPLSRPAPDGNVRLVSWNVHALPFDATRHQRLDNIAGEIARRSPDLVLLQEVWLEDDAARLACRLNADYERVPDAGAVKGLFGHRRGGLLAFVRRSSAWQVQGQASFEEYTASAPWYRLEELDGIAGKGFQGFTVSDGMRRVAVVNTHLQAQYPTRGNPYEAERLQQIRQLLAHAGKDHGAQALLVAGDFNVREEERAHYAALAGGFADLTADYRRACGCGTFVDRSGSESWWIDYVFARRADGGPVATRLERIRNRGRDDPFSDHHGLSVDWRLGTVFAPGVPPSTERGDHGADARRQDSEQRAGNAGAW
jgi:endonuclease/exonuclease/phosphatase family metal-dependent hydrolase